MTKTPRLEALCLALLLCPLAASAQPSHMDPLNDLERSALEPGRVMLEQGRSVTESHCKQCHGTDGAGARAGIPNLAGQRAVYLYRMLQEYKERERKNDSMNHAIGFLSEDALLSVSAYYAGLTPIAPTVTEEQAAVAAEVQESDPFADLRDTIRKCIKCHGEDGNSSASGMPNLSAQSPEYFIASMQAYAGGERNHRLMGKFAGQLDEAMLERMGVYYAVQEPARTETVGDGNADAGRALSEPCANCHGADGNAGGDNTPSLAGQDARYFAKAIKAYKDGKRHHEQMFDAVDQLGTDDIKNLAAFYAGQDPARRNVRTPFTTAEWIERCDRCHGIDGNSTDPRFPMLAGQDAAYLANAMQAYSGETRGNSAMHAMAAPLSTTDIRRIVAHYATQEPKSVVYLMLPCAEAPED